MIVKEQLHWVEGQYVRDAEICLLPHSDTFEAFAALMNETGSMVMDAPELEGRIHNQMGGRPFRVIAQDQQDGGLGTAIEYGILWENPVGLSFAPGTILPPEGSVITFRPTHIPTESGGAVNWAKEGECNIAVPRMPPSSTGPRRASASGRQARQTRRRRR